MQTKTEEI